MKDGTKIRRRLFQMKFLLWLILVILRKAKTKGYVLLTQHSPLNEETSVLIKDELGFEKVIGKKRYDGDEIYNILYRFSSTKDKSGNIIFAKSSPNATKTATNVAAKASSDYHLESLNGFIEYLKSDINPEYALCSTLQKRVAFHHGKVPEHIRILLEHYFSSGAIRTIVCTTTLMQGVNFPTRNIIIRNPDLALSESLTGYDFSNLKGRAGRLHKDFVGRTIILDEQAFDDSEVQLGMFEDKKVTFNYEEKFKTYSKVIEEFVASDVVRDDLHCKDMITKIRYTCVKYGRHGYNRLRKVGINLSPQSYDEVIKKMSSLQVPKEVVLNNPYWDPADLNILYVHYRNGLTPKIPKNFYHLDDYIKNILSYFSTYQQYYFKRYVDIYDKMFTPIAIMTKNWATGVKLSEIIDPPTWRIKKSEDIDDRISYINNKIRYGIAKLIRPLVAIEDPQSGIISAIEYGTLNTATKELIEQGVPREIAIKIPPNIFERFGLAGVRDYSHNLSQFDRIVISEIL